MDLLDIGEGIEKCWAAEARLSLASAEAAISGYYVSSFVENILESHAQHLLMSGIYKDK